MRWIANEVLWWVSVVVFWLVLSFIYEGLFVMLREKSLEYLVI